MIRGRIRLLFYLLSLELRRVVAYRVDFWVQALVGVTVNVLLGAYLWSSIYIQSGAETIGGYTYDEMVLYYLVASLMIQIIRGAEMGFLAPEIYDGSFSKFILYPVSPFDFKFAGYFSRSLVFSIQLILAVVLLVFGFGFKPDDRMSILSFLLGVSIALIGSYLCFLIGVVIEMIAFWADNVWSLMVMMRFVISLLGGAMLPLTFFPESLNQLLLFFPFRSLVFLPTETILGRTNSSELIFGLLNLFVWIVLFRVIAATVLRGGLKRFTGVGI